MPPPRSTETEDEKQNKATVLLPDFSFLVRKPSLKLHKMLVEIGDRNPIYLSYNGVHYNAIRYYPVEKMRIDMNREVDKINVKNLGEKNWSRSWKSHSPPGMHFYIPLKSQL